MNMMNIDNKLDYLKIISEEISKFDFLGNDEFLKEQGTNELLINEDLQKQFICDSLLDKMNSKIKVVRVEDSQINGDWNENNLEDANKVSLSYSIDVEYLYDSTQEPLKFKLDFDGESINISVGGWYSHGNRDTYVPPEGESYYTDFDWDAISVTLHTMNGEEVRFVAFENAPPKIQSLFIKDYIQSFIEEQSLEMRTNDQKDRIQDVPYC